MSFFGSLIFFVYLTVALIPAVVLGLLEKPLRYYSFFISLVFIYLIYSSKPVQFLYLAVFYLLEVALIKIYLVLRRKCGRKPWIYRLFLLLALFPIVACKISGIIHNGLFEFLGISYMTFRIIQVIIETYDGIIQEIRLFDLSAFILFFPSVSSGPIDRSRRFCTDFQKTYSRGEYLELLGIGFQKLLLGITYKFFISGFLYPIMNTYWKSMTPLGILAYVYVYGFNLFFDFAGYSLMAVGTSYIFGIRTPDNFRYPFISVDIKDFWDRWHITLSHWFRDFIFSRFMMQSIRKKWFKKRLNGAAVGLIVNMLVMGFWHGLTSYYILYGLYHGILLAVTEIYQKKSKFYAKHKNQKVYKIASWFITMNLVFFGFFIFSARFNTVMWELFHIPFFKLF